MPATAELPQPADSSAAPPADRREFLRAVSHELRTPLNAIIGFSQMMSCEIQGPVPEPYRQYADIIHDNGRHMLQLVEDLFEALAARAAAEDPERP
jgi:cell cycle sensor histidine kinase DivJ